MSAEYDDFDELWGGAEPEAPTSSEPLPAGKYEATVRAVKIKNWDDGSKSVEWEFQVCGGEHDGRITWMNAGMDEKRIRKTKGHFAFFGLDKLPTFAAVVAAFPTLEKRRVKISVSEYNGKLYTHLNALADAAPPVNGTATTPTLPGIPAQTTPFD